MTASVVLHAGLATTVILGTMRTVQAIRNERPVEIVYRQPEPDPPAEQVAPARPETPTEPTTGSIEIPRELVRLAELPVPPATLPPPGESGLEGLLRRGSPVVAAPGTPVDGAVFLAEQVEVPVAIAKGSPTPRYPAVLASTGIVGDARFRFVVDSAGRVEMNTIEQVLATHEAFATAVRATLPRMRFTPATYGGKPVRQLVELPFIFRASR